MYNPWKLPSKLKIADYIGSKRDREKYQYVFGYLLMPPLFVPLGLTTGGNNTYMAFLFLALWIVTINSNWKEIIQLYNSDSKRRRYVIGTIALACVSLIVSFIGNWLYIGISALIMLYWILFRVEVVFGNEPQIIEDDWMKSKK